MHKNDVRILCNIPSCKMTYVMLLYHCQEGNAFLSRLQELPTRLTPHLNILKNGGYAIMSEKNLVSVIESLKEWEALAEEAAAMVDSLKDQIKAEMTARNVEELEAGQYIARFTTVLSNRFDSTAFKKVMPDVYKAYTKQVSSRRFSIT